ncbi:MAG TPA: peptidylprolyl isomerase, partial [Patescibacteria group bacterium]|nr:peptidylprolyl isomerase [Patescibacteria group bacterium]
NETVAEHRERVLSEGRKFKYPYHHTKYHIVVITAGIVAITIISFFGFSFWQLYSAQNTGEFIHRLTQVLYVPVAKVDDQSVLYSDYLLELRSAIHYLSTKELVNFSSEDGKRQLEYQKRLALDKAIANTYASKLAKLQNVNVTDQDVNSFISNQVTVNRLGVSMDVYRQIIHDYYGWSFDDYKLSVKRQLLRRILVAKIDVEGRQRIESILSSLRSGADFATIAKQQSEDPLAKSNSGDIGFISKTADDPSGFIKVLSNLQPGQVSGVIEGVDGFYVVKLIEAKGNDLHIAKIYISYKTFTKQLAALKSAGKIKEYIKVSDTAKPKNN